MSESTEEEFNPHRIGSFLKQVPVQIIAGSSKTVYHVHPAILAAHSPMWRARLSAPWSQDGQEMDWTEFDCDIVERVLSFLYTGDYMPGDPELDEQAPCNRMPKPSDGLANSPRSLDRNEADSSPDSEIRSLPKLPKSVEPSACDSGAMAKGTPESCGSSVRMGKAFLIHAKIYTFADQFLAEKLQHSAVSHIAHLITLGHIPEDSKCPDNLASLFPEFADAVAHIYGNTVPCSQSDYEARNKLSSFVASAFNRFRRHFEPLYFCNVEFLVDVLTHLGALHAEATDGLKVLKTTVEELKKESRTPRSNSEAEWSFDMLSYSRRSQW